VEEYKTMKDSKFSKIKTLVMLRRGWSIRKLWILSIIGITGLALDASFHTIQTGTPLTIIFDGADFSTGEIITKLPYHIFALSWSGHITFLAAFGLLIVLPRVFFDKATAEVDSRGQIWMSLKDGRSINQMWSIALIGVAGIALDIAFHWMQDGDPSKVVFNGFEDPNPMISLLAISAHVMFLGAFTLLIFLPKILFSKVRKSDLSESKEYSTI
jgi:hypothetical protein